MAESTRVNDVELDDDRTTGCKTRNRAADHRPQPHAEYPSPRGERPAAHSPIHDGQVTVNAAEQQPKDHRFAQPEAKLLAAAVSGDPVATQTLLTYLRPLVFRYCLGRLGGWSRGSSGTDDCAQDVLLAVVSALPGYRLPPDKFLAFVFGIARHKVVDVYRRQTKDRTDSVADFGERDRGGRDPGYDEIEQRHSVSRLLATLTPQHREILTMRVIFGYSAQETAIALNMPSAGAVRVTQHRALAALRRRLAADATESCAVPPADDR